jgi:aspartate racemase
MVTNDLSDSGHRKGFEVTVRGHRLEIAEIETALREAPGIGDAVVIVRNELPDDRCLAAYVVRVREPGRVPPSSSTLREFLKGRLPDWSIPAVFVFIDSLPTTSTGTIDRQGLPVPDCDPVELTREFIAPRNDLKERLVAIWEELLHLRPIAVADEFFDLGGDSLLGLRLCAEIEKALGRELPLDAIVSAPTIERLAEVLAGTPGRSPRPLMIALKSSGSRLPLFSVPGSIGHPLSLYELARLSDPEQPVYGLEYPEDRSEQPYPARIEDLAARFLPEIRAIQPEGPYRLAGHSFGGLVAFELAHQLVALGQEVSLLALFDTWGKGYPAPRPIAGRVNRHLKQLATLNFRAQRANLAARTLGVYHRLASSLPRALRKRFSRPMTRSEELDAIIQTARRNYQPRTFPGRLVLFRAEQIPDWIGSCVEDPYLGWGGLAAKGIEICPVPGDHLTLLHRANVGSLARQLEAYLRE